MGKASKAVLACLEETGIRQSELARRIGIDVRNLNQRIHRQNDIKFEDFEMMMECIGYKLNVEKLECGAYRIGENVAEGIISGNSNGKFWYESDGMYVGVVKFGDDVKQETFSRKEVLLGWLERDGAMPWES